MFKKLDFILPNIYKINHKIDFSGELIAKEFMMPCFDFAYAMTFGKDGHHRNLRTGGQSNRKGGEQFINCFQGKLAEYAIHQKFQSLGLATEIPDLTIMGEGLWDDSDFVINSNKISVKSAAHFSNLMLLEKQDWDVNGNYIPNLTSGNASYDYFVLCRLKPDAKQLMRDQKLFYSNQVEKATLQNIIFKATWTFDIAGFIKKDELIYLIKNEFCIPQNALLNGRINMDASNYYIQCGNLHPIAEMVAELLS